MKKKKIKKMILSNSRTLLEVIEEAKLNGFKEEFIFIDSQLKGRKIIS